VGALDAQGRFVSSSKVTLEIDRGVAVMTLANPPVNAIDTSMVRQVGRALDRVAATSSVRVMILTAEGGRLFSAGSDILEISTMLAPGVAVREKLGPQFDVFDRLERLPIPTIGALNGDVLGGGLEIAVCCDLLMAEEQILLGSPEIRVGLFPSSGGPFRVARRVGPARAKQMQLLGQPISARTACAWGLVNEVVPRGRALGEAHSLAQTLVQRPRGGLAAVKSVINAAHDLAGQELVSLSLAASEVAFTSEAGSEGVTAFLEKRPARFESPG
jgi:enoyl-CoA hydratase